MFNVKYYDSQESQLTAISMRVWTMPQMTRAMHLFFLSFLQNRVLDKARANALGCTMLCGTKHEAQY